MHTIGKNDGLGDLFLSGWRPYAWIALIIVLLYARTLSFEFTCLDDKELILDNYDFISNVSNIPQAFMSRIFPNMAAPYYRPLLTVTFMLNSLIGGASLVAYHATNILIHIAVCCMVFLLLRRFAFTGQAAFLGTVFFAVHPALAQAVAWVPGRNDSLLALFALASFLYFMKYLEDREGRHLFFHMAFFCLALFTKETAISLIPVCVIYTALLAKKAFPPRAAKTTALLWLIIAAFWFAVRTMALQGSFDSPAEGLAAALYVSLPAVVQYVGKAMLPFNLSVFPTIRDTTFLYGAAAALLLVLALWRSRDKRWPFIWFGLCWFIVFLAPSLVRPNAAYVHDFQEHRLYLPLVGMILVFGEIDMFKRTGMAAAGPLIFFLCVLAAINVRHAENFRNRLAYWENAALTSPHSLITHLKVGYMYYDSGMLAKAEEEYKKVLRLDRVQAGAYAGLGHVYLAGGRLNDAELAFRRAIAACNASYPSYVSLGTIYYRQGRLREAADMWVEALKLHPKCVDALRNLAIFCAQQKDYKLAMFYAAKLRQLGVEPPAQFLKEIGGQ